jgi:hypothetical protein
LVLYISYAGLPGLDETTTATLTESLPAAPACPRVSICLYPQPDYAGKPMIVKDPNTGVPREGRCTRFPVRSVINNALSGVGVAQEDGSSKDYDTTLRRYNNPDCNAKVRHRSKGLQFGDQNPDLKFPPTGRVRAFRLNTTEVRPMTKH